MADIFAQAVRMFLADAAALQLEWRSIQALRGALQMYDREQEQLQIARTPEIVRTWEQLRVQTESYREARLRARAHADRVATEARVFSELDGPGQAGIDEASE